MLLHRGGETVDICLLDEQMRANVDGFVVIVKDIVGGASGIEIAGRWFVARSSVSSSAVAPNCPSNGARASHASLIPTASTMDASRHRFCWQRMRRATMTSAARNTDQVIVSEFSNKCYWFSIIAGYFSRLWRRTTS